MSLGCFSRGQGEFEGGGEGKEFQVEHCANRRTYTVTCSILKVLNETGDDASEVRSKQWRNLC